MSLKLPIDYKQANWITRKLAREQYIEEQEGLCWYCKQPLKQAPSVKVINAWINKRLFPTNFFDYPIHLHHSHRTGMTIGAVHNKCNAYMWQYEGE